MRASSAPAPCSAGFALPEGGPAVGDPLGMPGSISPCRLCPRRCGARRAEGELGACGAGATMRVARAALHFWEEPPLSGERGSGAVFFSHCPLGCVFCQNGRISHDGWGVDVSPERLAEAMLDLERQGAHNVNLVTATHYAPMVRESVRVARSRGLGVPVVYNSSGYENVEVVDALGEVVQVWLPDYKYADPALAAGLSRVPDYPDVALDAIARMAEQVERRGGRLCDDGGTMLRGVIVRHLVLPGHVDNSLAALQRLWDRFGNSVDISVMNQYTPVDGVGASSGRPELDRAVTDEEYEAVLDFADLLGFENMWWQQGGTVGESFVPLFDGTGVVR